MNNSPNSTDPDKTVAKFSIHKGLGRTLFLWFITLSLLPLAIVSYIGFKNYEETTQHNLINHLITSSELKARYIDAYFENITATLTVQSELKNNLQFLEALKQSYVESGLPLSKFIDSFAWAILTDEFSFDAQQFVTTYNYLDLLIIDDSGNILYTVRGHDNLGTNLFNDIKHNRLFSTTARQSLSSGRPQFSDFTRYTDSQNQVSAFITTPMIDDAGDIKGIMALHISSYEINTIMTNRIGLGETGETFLIGKDLLMRSQSRFSDDLSALNTKVDSQNTRLWRSSLETGSDDKTTLKTSRREMDNPYIKVSRYNDYRNIETLGTYYPLDIVGVQLAIITKLDLSEAHAPIIALRNIIGGLFIFTLIVVVVAALVTTRRITRPVQELTAWAHDISKGRLDHVAISTPDNELGELNESMTEVARSFAEITGIVDEIADGNYTSEITVRSYEDVLAQSINDMLHNFKSIVSQANNIAAGDFSAEIAPRSTGDALGRALSNMTLSLRQIQTKNDRQNWLKTSLAQVLGIAQGTRNLETLAEKIIYELSLLLNFEHGVFYIIDNNFTSDVTTYRLCSHYASARSPQQIIEGEGLLGQAAISNTISYIDDVPPDHCLLQSGTGGSRPVSLAIIPLVMGDTAVGLIELASLDTFNPIEKELLSQLTTNLGITINALLNHLRTEDLLLESQRMTEEARAQTEELQASNEELEAKSMELEEQKQEIERRRNDIAQARDDLQVKASELEQSNQFKSEFLANMSHELRTPLNSLLILARLLADNDTGNLTPDQVESAKVIYSGGNDLLSLINDILDLSKVEAGQLNVQMEKVEVENLFTRLDGMLGPMVREKGVDLVFNIDKEAPAELVTDGFRAEQILRNLLSNASKFTKQGAICVEATVAGIDTRFVTESLSNCEQVLAISVTDTGIGISEHKQEEIFQAFKQADGTIMRKHGGTGLGLTISRELAHLLGGELHLISKEGEGSTFTLYLPASESERELENTAAENQADVVPIVRGMAEIQITGEATYENPVTAPLETARVVTGRPALTASAAVNTVLIIEDDTGFSKTLQSLAHQHHFETLVAATGKQAIEMALSNKPGGIILDLGLPDIDGEKVIHELRQHPETKRTPIHIISGRDKSEDMESKAVSFLTKPATAEQILDILDNIKFQASATIDNLLVIDSDELYTTRTCSLLEQQYLNIDTAHTGVEAIDALGNHEYQCMILDLDLNDMDGMDLLTQLDRNGSNLPPVIIYTTRVLDEETYASLHKYSNSIIMKTDHSEERLKDECTLFLHSLPSKNGKVEAPHEPEALLKNKKILLVDDDLRNTYALSKALSTHGLSVTMADNGALALEKLDQMDQCDLVLMDIMMPIMDGYEAIRKIRGMEEHTTLPIIALTAKSMQHDREKCISVGASDYMSKPIDLDQLLSMIRVWLSAR